MPPSAGRGGGRLRGFMASPGQSKYCLRYAGHKLAPLNPFHGADEGVLKRLRCKWLQECLHTLVYSLSAVQKDLFSNDDTPAPTPRGRRTCPLPPGAHAGPNVSFSIILCRQTSLQAIPASMRRPSTLPETKDELFYSP